MMKNVKRILSALIAGALLCTGTVFSTASAEETYLLGDVDCNGEVTSDDAVYVLFYYGDQLINDYTKSNSYFEYLGYDLNDKESYISVMDVSGDGVANCDDATLMLMFYGYTLVTPDATAEEIWENVLNRDLPQIVYPGLETAE